MGLFDTVTNVPLVCPECGAPCRDNVQFKAYFGKFKPNMREGAFGGRFPGFPRIPVVAIVGYATHGLHGFDVWIIFEKAVPVRVLYEQPMDLRPRTKNKLKLLHAEAFARDSARRRALAMQGGGRTTFLDRLKDVYMPKLSEFWAGYHDEVGELFNKTGIGNYIKVKTKSGLKWKRRASAPRM